MEIRDIADRLFGLIESRAAVVGVIGMGYVGLPLAAATARAGFPTVGFDIDESKPKLLNAGTSYIEAVKSADLSRFVAAGAFRATSEMEQLGACDVIVICVPTPLTRNREPDLSFIRSTAHEIAGRLRPGQLIVLESTTYPGTTDEVVRPILEERGLLSERQIFLGFSPEREDPGNSQFGTANIPKVVGGAGPSALRLMQTFYGAVVEQVVPVSSLSVAEAVKITENVFRAVNIALVNELKVVYDAMGIDVWEVIEAAKTKPFGYMPFYPGPGLGGHCIPIDPFYLSWKSREFDISTRFIELAGEINTAMPNYVVKRLEEALDKFIGRSLGRSRILVLGLAYKKNIPDIRESPSIRIVELIEKRGAVCDFSDPYVPSIPPTREHASLQGRRSVAVTEESIAAYDAIVIATDHDDVDYELVARTARVIVDTRNVLGRKGLASPVCVKA